MTKNHMYIERRKDCDNRQLNIFLVWKESEHIFCDNRALVIRRGLCHINYTITISFFYRKQYTLDDFYNIYVVAEIMIYSLFLSYTVVGV